MGTYEKTETGNGGNGDKTLCSSFSGRVVSCAAAHPSPRKPFRHRRLQILQILLRLWRGNLVLSGNGPMRPLNIELRINNGYIAQAVV